MPAPAAPGSEHPLSLQHDYQRRLMRSMSIMQEYAEGTPIEDIADKYDVALSTVCKWARKAGLTRNRARAMNADAIAEQYRIGTPLKDICAAYRVDRKTVWRFAARAGIPLRRAALSPPLKEGG